MITSWLLLPHTHLLTGPAEITKFFLFYCVAKPLKQRLKSLAPAPVGMSGRNAKGPNGFTLMPGMPAPSPAEAYSFMQFMQKKWVMFQNQQQHKKKMASTTSSATATTPPLPVATVATVATVPVAAVPLTPANTLGKNVANIEKHSGLICYPIHYEGGGRRPHCQRNHWIQFQLCGIFGIVLFIVHEHCKLIG